MDIELSAVFPALNEKENIPALFAEAERALSRFCARWEVVLVDDGSTDGTADLAEELAARGDGRFRVIRHPRNLGYAAAIRDGFAAARLPLVFYSDADLQFDLHDLRRLLPHLADHEIVSGRRRHRADAWPRRAASRVFNTLAGILLGIRVRDIDSAFKVFRRSFLEEIEIESDHFLFDTEVLYKARLSGRRVKEVPVRHRPRRGGRSTVKLRDVRDTLRGFLWLLGNRRRWTARR